MVEKELNVNKEVLLILLKLLLMLVGRMRLVVLFVKKLLNLLMKVPQRLYYGENKKITSDGGHKKANKFILVDEVLKNSRENPRGTFVRMIKRIIMVVVVKNVLGKNLVDNIANS